MLFNRDNRYDSVLLFAVLVLVMIGLCIIYSASSFRAEEKYGDAAMFFKQHLVRAGLGLLAMLIASRINYRRYRWVSPFLFLTLVVLLVMVFSGEKVNGSRRALSFFGKDFQPSEFVKLAVIFYVASLFSGKWLRGELPRNRIMIHYLILMAVIGLVFLEPDMGTSLVIFCTVMTMFFLAGVEWKTIFYMLACLVPLIGVGLLAFSYQLKRVTDFIGSLSGVEHMSYQVRQSIMGLANGGLTGTGYASGTQKLFFLPEPFSDFILASLGEEMGFAGIFFVFLLLCVILWRGVRIALHAPDRYGMLIAGGITFMIMINAVINAGVTVNLLPTTGLPFPFLSYGGSSLFVLLLGVGIMLNISSEKPEDLKHFTRNRAGSVTARIRR